MLLRVTLLLTLSLYSFGVSGSIVEPGRTLSGNYLSALVAEHDDDYANAALFYRRALMVDSENVPLLERSFEAFLSNGDFDDAVRLSRLLSRLDSLPEMARLVLALDHVRGKEWSSAFSVLSIDWQSPFNRLVSVLMEGWVLSGEGRPEAALRVIDRLDGPVWYDLFLQYHGGLIALHGGLHDEGVLRLEAAFRNKAGGRGAEQTYIRVIESLTYTYARLGYWDRALSLSDHFRRTYPNHVSSSDLHSVISSRVVPSHPIATPQRGIAEVFFNLGTALSREQDEVHANRFLQLSNFLAPNEDVIMVHLAGLYDRRYLHDRANELYIRIPRDSLYYRISRLELAINHAELDDLPASRDIFERLIVDFPDDYSVYTNYAAVLSNRMLFDEVLSVLGRFERRIESPIREHWNLYYRLGIAYERTHRWPDAEAYFKRSLSLYPDQPDVLNYLGYSWIDMGIHLEEGLDLIRRAVRVRSNDGYIVDSLGWAYYRLGRYEEAVIDLERAVSLRPDDATINDHLGDAYWRVGRRLEAIFQWRHALSFGPPTPEEVMRIERKLEDGLDAVERADKG